MNSDRKGDSRLRASFAVSHLALVFFGGTLGTLVRAVLLDVSGADRAAWAMWLVNVAGAFGLGFLLEALGERRETDPRVQRYRLFLGVGFFGGFTTYSFISLLMATLLLDGQIWAAAGYGLVTLALGAAATIGGVAMGAWRRGDRVDHSTPRRGDTP